MTLQVIQKWIQCKLPHTPLKLMYTCKCTYVWTRENWILKGEHDFQVSYSTNGPGDSSPEQEPLANSYIIIGAIIHNEPYTPRSRDLSEPIHILLPQFWRDWHRGNHIKSWYTIWRARLKVYCGRIQWISNGLPWKRRFLGVGIEVPAVTVRYMHVCLKP